MASAASQLIEEVTARVQRDRLLYAREICADGTYFLNNFRTYLCLYIRTYIHTYYIHTKEFKKNDKPSYAQHVLLTHIRSACETDGTHQIPRGHHWHLSICPTVALSLYPAVEEIGVQGLLL